MLFGEGDWWSTPKNFDNLAKFYGIIHSYTFGKSNYTTSEQLMAW